MRKNLSDLKPNNKLYNMGTHEMSNSFLKKNNFKIPKVKEEELVDRCNNKVLKNS